LTEQDRQKWNSRYLKNIGNSDPSEILKKFVSRAPKGIALDIACGNGRNSKFLAQQGFQVDAVDISDIALGHLKNKGIDVIYQDIDTWQIPQNRYQMIISIHFMDRRLFPGMQTGLKPGGLLIFESFVDDNKGYCLKHNELLNAFEFFNVLHYEEKEMKKSGKFDKSVSFVAIKKGGPVEFDSHTLPLFF